MPALWFLPFLNTKTFVFSGCLTLQMHPDQKYIDAILNNNIVLLEDLYKRIAVKIQRFVLQNNGCETDAADLVQDALLAIFAKACIGQFELTCPIDAFLFVLCRKNWLKKLQKKRLERVTFLHAGEYSNIGDDSFRLAEECLAEQERKNLVFSCLAQLGDGCRQLLQLNWSGKAMEEVAQILNMSYGYARKRKSLCMQKLVSLVKQSPVYLQVK
jgi:RNA polymerase sigma factor (sigma-70 family)